MTTDERMEKMEKELARLRWFNRCLIGCIVLSLGVCFIWKTLGPETAWAQSRAKEIRASKFILEDPNGKPCATLGYIENKGPALLLLDKNDVVRASLDLTPKGPGLELIDENHNTRVQLHEGLMLRDENETPRVVLGILGRQGPQLVLIDQNKRPRAGINALKGEPRVWLRDQNGKPRAALTVTEDGPNLSLTDENGKTTWSTP
jgi:hypothetical protein